MVRTRQFLIVTAALFALLFSFVQAQDKKKEADKKAPIAPAEKLAEGWDEIDERLIFLMVRLANTETSLEAVEKTIAASSRKASVKTGDAKRAINENEKMDRKGGGPMKWSQFYGTTAEKFFYHPTDRNSFYHTQTVLSPQPPQNDNQTAPGIPSRQGLPVHQRPPQFDYIYKANQGAAAKAEAEAGLLKGKVEALAARRRKLELEQVALWVEIAFRAAAHFELNKKPVFRFEPILAADDPDAKLHADIMKTSAAFMRVALSIVDEAPKDQDGTLVRIKPAISDAREKLNDAWLRLAVDTSDKKTVEGKFAALAKRLDDVSRNLTESYEISVDGDMNADELRKDTFRGQLQGSLVSYAQIVLALDEMATQMRDQWKVKPDLDKPFGTVNLASITPVRQPVKDSQPPKTGLGGAAAKQVWIGNGNEFENTKLEIDEIEKDGTFTGTHYIVFKNNGTTKHQASVAGKIENDTIFYSYTRNDIVKDGGYTPAKFVGKFNPAETRIAMTWECDKGAKGTIDFELTNPKEIAGPKKQPTVYEGILLPDKVSIRLVIDNTNADGTFTGEWIGLLIDGSIGSKATITGLASKANIKWSYTDNDIIINKIKWSPSVFVGVKNRDTISAGWQNLATGAKGTLELKRVQTKAP